MTYHTNEGGGTSGSGTSGSGSGTSGSGSGTSGSGSESESGSGSGTSGNTAWLSDASANRHIKTYVKDFLDVSGNFAVRQAQVSNTYEILGQVITNRYQSSNVQTGYSVDMDISGNTIVVGELGDVEGNYNGRARAFRYDASSQLWYQHGNALVDPDNGASDNKFGRVVHISDDGNVIASIDTHWNSNEGKFHIFNYNSSTDTWDREYSQRSSLSGGYFGHTGSHLSGDGNVIAINEQYGDWSCNIFKKVSGSWIQVGRIGNASGFQTVNPRLNYDGTRMVVRMRAPRYYVRVYAYNGADVASTSQAAFSQVGSDISNPSSGDSHAESTAINKAGDIIAFSSEGTDLVYVYRYNNATSDWVQHGSSLQGVNGGDNPGRGNAPNQAINLNDDGDYLLFGTYAVSTISLYKYTEGPLGINGYYPLYTTAQLASNASPDGSGYHSHDLENTTYYMPNGLNMNASNGPITQWHGDYSPSSSPFAVNGYYPLYTTAQAASNASPDGSGYHTHDLTLNATTTTYYMPNGLTLGSTQWHGDFVTNGDWVQFGSTLTGTDSTNFGLSTAFNNDATRIIVGAELADLTSTNGGAAYVYQLNDSTPSNDTLIDVSYGTLQLYSNTTTTSDVYSLDRLQYLSINDKITFSFGVTTDINADGSVIVVGAQESDFGSFNTTNNTSLDNVGRAFVYQKNSSGAYVPFGNILEGDIASARFGRRVAIDNSGNRIAVSSLAGSAGAGSNRGRLQMYEISGNDWTQLGSDIDGDADNDRFGEMAMHISGNGNVVVGHAGNNNQKYIRAYEYVDASGDWYQLGSDITDFPTGHNDWSHRVQLSDDGRILAFGNSFDDTTGTNNGRLQVYKFTGDVNDGSWNALGSYITSKTSEASASDYWGHHSVSLSSDGYTVAWQSFYAQYDSNQHGRAQVYRYYESGNEWMQLGSDITRQYDTSPVADIHFGRHCHLSGDGNTIVITSNYDDDGASNGGGYYAYKYINGDWTQVATYFESLQTELYVGEHSLRISKDGTHVITGSYRYDNGNGTNTGMAVVCKLNRNGTSTTDPAFILASDEIKTPSLHFKHDGAYTSMLNHPDGQDLITNIRGSTTNPPYGSTRKGLTLSSKSTNSPNLTVDSQGTLYVTYANAVSQAAATTRAYWQSFGHSNASLQWSFYAHGAILSDSAIIASRGGLSDRRIKTNIQTINDASSLEKLRLLNPCTYEYIDKIRKSSYPVEGFIAQEVKEVLPYAVDDDLEYTVPNIYKLGYLELDASGNKIINIPDYDTANLEVDASGNIYDQLALYDNNLSHAKEHNTHPEVGDRYDVNIVKVISSTSIQIEPIHSDTLPEEIFVYGQIVKNFNTLNKNRIFTIMTSALQEVDRQLQAERTKTASLETELASLIADVTALENA